MKRALYFVGRSVRNWTAEMIGVFLFFPIVLAMIKFAKYLTGRPPTSGEESANFLVQFGFRCGACLFLILLVSLFRQGTGHFWTKADIKEKPALAWPPMIATVAIAYLFAYILLH